MIPKALNDFQFALESFRDEEMLDLLREETKQLFAPALLWKNKKALQKQQQTQMKGPELEGK